MRWTIRADKNAPAAARIQATKYLTAAVLSETVLGDIVLATSELVTNAVDAGATQIQLEIAMSRHRVRLSVDDDTGGWPRPTSTNPAASRGRGLAIVSQIADNWYAESTPAGKRITAYFVKA